MNKTLSVELKILGRTLLLSALLALISGVIVYYTPLPESLLSPLGKIILIFTIFIAGCLVSKAYGSKGLVRGMSMGIIYFILVLAFTFIFDPSIVSFKIFLAALLTALTAGGLGGILGIGLTDN